MSPGGGAATWSFSSDDGIELKFEDSDVSFWAGHGFMVSYAWDEIEMVSCLGISMGELQHSCGTAVEQVLPACNEP